MSKKYFSFDEAVHDITPFSKMRPSPISAPLNTTFNLSRRVRIGRMKQLKERMEKYADTDTQTP